MAGLDTLNIFCNKGAQSFEIYEIACVEINRFEQKIKGNNVGNTVRYHSSNPLLAPINV